MDMETNDCAVLALQRVTGLSYEACHAALQAAGRQFREGTPRNATKAALKILNWRIVHIWSPAALAATTGQRSLPTTQSVSLRNEAWQALPDMLLFMPRHVAAFRAGKIIDWSADNRIAIEAGWQVAPQHAKAQPPEVIYL